MTPRFSVVVITHDQVEHAELALRSILSDGVGDIEVVCVDDGSTDGTADLLHRLAVDHPCVRVIPHPHVGRPSVLRNVGIEAATGEWVSFLDGDDLYDASRFNTLREVLATCASAPDVVFHDHTVFVDPQPPASGSPRISAHLEQRLLAHAAEPTSTTSADGRRHCLDGDRLGVFLLAETFLMHTSSFCVRRDLLVSRNIRFDETRIFGEDHPFMLDCVVGSSVTYVPERLSFYRRHARSLTAVRTPSAQTELVHSMHAQFHLLERRTPRALQSVNRSAIRQHLLSETLHLGYLLEKAGSTRHAVGIYLRATTRFRTPIGWLRAAKALVRKPK